MTKAIRPTDGRLKANRDFNRFMLRAVHMPSVLRARGEFKVEAEPKRSADERLASARTIDDLSNADLLWLLHMRLREEHGIATLAPVMNMVAHLRSRARRHGWGELSGGAQ